MTEVHEEEKVDEEAPPEPSPAPAPAPRSRSARKRRLRRGSSSESDDGEAVVAEAPAEPVVQDDVQADSPGVIACDCFPALPDLLLTFF